MAAAAAWLCGGVVTICDCGKTICGELTTAFCWLTEIADEVGLDVATAVFAGIKSGTCI